MLYSRRASTTSTSIKMSFPPNWIEKEEMRPCDLNNPPSNVVNKVGYGVSSGDSISFYQDNEITHVEVPSSTTILQIMCLMYTTLI